MYKQFAPRTPTPQACDGHGAADQPGDHRRLRRHRPAGQVPGARAGQGDHQPQRPRPPGHLPHLTPRHTLQGPTLFVLSFTQFLVKL